MVESEDKKYGKLYSKITHEYMKSLLETPNGKEVKEMLNRQAGLVSFLSKTSSSLRNSKDTRLKKIENLRSVIQDAEPSLASFEPLMFPLDPSKQVTGIIPGTSASC
jgi:phosphatidylinositol 3-kinase